MAPHPVTNREFTATLGRVLGRPAVLPAPESALRLVFGGMADELLLTSQRTIPARLIDSGFDFAFPTLEDALRHELGRARGFHRSVATVTAAQYASRLREPDMCRTARCCISAGRVCVDRARSYHRREVRIGLVPLSWSSGPSSASAGRRRVEKRALDGFGPSGRVRLRHGFKTRAGEWPGCALHMVIPAVPHHSGRSVDSIPPCWTTRFPTMILSVC